jgi:penicillin-binding protein 1A
VVGVWVGNDDGSRMRKVTGGTLPARLWHEIMLYAHQNKTPLPLPGTSAARLQEAVASQPWHAPAKSGDDAPLFQRVLGAFSSQ